MPTVTRPAIEHVFREEYGRAVAVLAREFGDIDIAAEAVQEAFATAVARWPDSGRTDNATEISFPEERIAAIRAGLPCAGAGPPD